MHKSLNIVAIFNSISLLIIALMLLLFWLASAHVNFKDYSQLKYLFEIVIFIVGAILLLAKRKKLNEFDWVLFLSLILIEASFLDLYFETRSVDYSQDSPFIIFFAVILIFGINLTLLVAQARKLIGI